MQEPPCQTTACDAVHGHSVKTAASHARASSRPPAAYDECSGAVQPSLRYNVSSRTEPEVPVPVGAGESLATAVCCDSRTQMFAEPQFLYASPDIDLFAKLAPSGATTFYDAVCGLPLFTAPTNRSAADFKADTDEHGWPSFRTAEVKPRCSRDVAEEKDAPRRPLQRAWRSAGASGPPSLHWRVRASRWLRPTW